MYFSIISTCMLLFAAIQVSHGHVRLTFPPARFPDYDFLDNVRTGGPCGVPGKYLATIFTSKRSIHVDLDELIIDCIDFADDLDGAVTTFQAGATFNVSFHLAYSHRVQFRMLPWVQYPLTDAVEFIRCKH